MKLPEMLQHLKAYGTKQPPAISATTAIGLTLLFALLYVAPFYLSPTLRSTPLANRNNPAVIKARVSAVGWCCLACTVITVLVLRVWGHASLQEQLRLLGLYPIRPLDVVKCMLLMSILFVGPLYEAAIVEGHWRHWWSPRNIKAELYDDWTGYRNFVVGPASEELVFRSLAISLFLLAKSSALRIVFVSPLLFGLAHLHHLHEFIVLHQKPDSTYMRTLLTPRILAFGLLRVLVMFGYTSLFGFIAAFLYVRTGSLLSCILAHAFCNWRGLPRLWGRVGQDLDDETSDTLTSPAQDVHGLSIGWTIAYYFLLVAGAVGFWRLRWTLTESNLALARF